MFNNKFYPWNKYIPLSANFVETFIFFFVCFEMEGLLLPRKQHNVHKIFKWAKLNMIFLMVIIRYNFFYQNLTSC
jgi:hypothetical protein